MRRACGIHWGEETAYRVLVGKPEGKRPLRRPTHRWVDNIKMNLLEVGFGTWTGLISLRTVTHSRL
jgi:hypothetical protein